MKKFFKKIFVRLQDYYYIIFKYSSEGQLRIQRLEREGDYDPIFNSYSAFKKYQRKVRFTLVTFLSFILLIIVSGVIIIFLLINVLVLFFSSNMSIQEWITVFRGRETINEQNETQYKAQEIEKIYDLKEGVEVNIETKTEKNESEKENEQNDSSDEVYLVEGNKIKNGDEYYLVTSPLEWIERENKYISPIYNIEDGKKEFRFVTISGDIEEAKKELSEIWIATTSTPKALNIDWNDDCSVYIDSVTQEGTLINSKCIKEKDKYVQYKFPNLKSSDFSKIKEIIVTISWGEL